MPSLPTRKLSQETPAATVLPGDRVVLLRRPQDEADPAKRVKPTGLQALSDALGSVLGNWNAQKNPLKVVRTYADLLDLNPLSCCRGTKGVVLDDTPGYPAGDYLLLYTDHANAWNYVCQDGTFDQNPNNLTDAAWFAIDSPEAADANIPVLDPTRTDYPFPFTVKYVIGGTTYYYGTTAAGGPFPAPTTAAGTANWSPESAPLTPSQFYQPITVAVAQAIAQADNAIQPITYRILRGTDVNGRRGDVQVQGLVFSPALTPDEGDFPAQFASIVLWQDPLDGIWKSRRYDVVTDTVYPLDVTPPPFVLEDLGGNFTSYDTADSAFAASAEDYVLDVNRNESPLAASAVLFGVVNGRNRNLTGNTGVTLTFGASLQLNDLNFVSGGLALETSGNSTVVNYSHGRFTRPLRIRATDVLIATYVDLSGVVTVEGTLTLRTGSTVPSGFFTSFTRHADGTYTTPAGGTVLDERAGYVTATDIEITDPTKGIIMTVGSTRVRARIAGTAGARTWTFTDL